jgi:mono/diheme cytochrome c family protein
MRVSRRRFLLLVLFALSTIAAPSALAPARPAPIPVPIATAQASQPATVQAGPPAPPAQPADDPAAHETFLRVCTKCHPADRVLAEGRTRTQWENTIVSMQTSRDAVISAEEFAVVLEYLSRFHGPGPSTRPAEPVAGRGAAPTGPRAHVGAADRHRVDPAGAARGQKLYAAECVTCHGAQARGTERGANLVRSARVLRDRYGSAIGPYLKKGHPMETGAASASLTAEQIADLAHFIWDRINSTLRGAPEFDVKNVLTGRPTAGQAYFNGAGGCAACHSPTGDLAGYGKRYAPVEIQQRFVFPSASPARGASRPQVTATIVFPDGSKASGVLVSLDDFHVAIRDERGHRSWRRTDGMTITRHDPFAAHVALLDRLTDEAMHDVVAYLESLK